GVHVHKAHSAEDQQTAVQPALLRLQWKMVAALTQPTLDGAGAKVRHVRDIDRLGAADAVFEAARERLLGADTLPEIPTRVRGVRHRHSSTRLSIGTPSLSASCSSSKSSVC